MNYSKITYGSSSCNVHIFQFIMNSENLNACLVFAKDFANTRLSLKKMMELNASKYPDDNCILAINGGFFDFSTFNITTIRPIKQLIINGTEKNKQGS